MRCGGAAGTGCGRGRDCAPGACRHCAGSRPRARHVAASAMGAGLAAACTKDLLKRLFSFVRPLPASALALPALPALAAADFAACFRLDPGVSWSSGAERACIVPSPPGGESALAVVASEGRVTAADVYAPNGRVLLVTIRCGVAAAGADAIAPVMTDSFDPAPNLPATATPDQCFCVTTMPRRPTRRSTTTVSATTPSSASRIWRSKSTTSRTPSRTAAT